MSELKEKANQFKKLVSTLNLTDIRDQQKLANAIVDAFDQIAEEVEKLESMHMAMQEQVNVIDEDLGALEDEIYEEEENGFVEVVCPHCEKEVTFVEEEIADAEEVECPICHKTFEIEWECEDDDCDCGCDCGCDDHKNK